MTTLDIIETVETAPGHFEPVPTEDDSLIILLEERESGSYGRAEESSYTTSWRAA